jgi:hypothetical protein
LKAGTLVANKSVCYNTSPGELSSTLPSGGTGLTYKWEQSANGTSNWTEISGATSATYAPAALTATVYYRRTVTSGGNCGSATATAVKITVYGELKAGTLVADKSVCYNTSPGELSGSAASGGATPYTYKWEENTSNIATGWTTASGSGNSVTYTPPALNPHCSL